MYQLLLCANSALNAFGQFSLLKRASTSCEKDARHTFNITYNTGLEHSFPTQQAL